MKKKSILLLVIMSLMSFMLVGCNLEVSDMFIIDINGKVSDSATGIALSGVKVSVSGISTKTDANGYYSLKDISVSYNTSIVFEKTGYSSSVYNIVSYPSQGTLFLDMALRQK